MVYVLCKMWIQIWKWKYGVKVECIGLSRLDPVAALPLYGTKLRGFTEGYSWELEERNTASGSYTRRHCAKYFFFLVYSNVSCGFDI